MKTIKLTPAVSNKPCDIERRLSSALSHAESLVAYLGGVDPTSLPEGQHALALTQAQGLVAAIVASQGAAPKKRSYVRKADEVAEEPAPEAEVAAAAE